MFVLSHSCTERGSCLCNTRLKDVSRLQIEIHGHGFILLHPELLTFPAPSTYDAGRKRCRQDWKEKQ